MHGYRCYSVVVGFQQSKQSLSNVPQYFEYRRQLNGAVYLV